MKLAMVTTACAERSAVSRYSRALAAELAQRVDLTVFVEPAAEQIESTGWRVRSVDELFPREFDQVLHQVGDEASLAFTAPLIRSLGGAVALHDWNLTRFATAAYPALRRGGVRALCLAVREGGVGQALELRRGGSPALNRSVVRFGDAFLTHSTLLGDAILEERNAPTPIVVLEPKLESGLEFAPEPARAGAQLAARAVGGAWSALAAGYVEALGRFPRPRSSRRTLIALGWAAYKRRSSAN